MACLWPNDTDANAFRAGFKDPMATGGAQERRRDGYQDGISGLQRADQHVQEGPTPTFSPVRPYPRLPSTFWKQAAQQGYKPKLATVAKVMLFPSEAEALGTLSNNIATDLWWSPSHPYKSSLTGDTAKQLADKFAASTGKQWTQALGSVYSLFEIAAEVMRAVADPHDHKAVALELNKLSYEGMSGPLDFAAGPEPGIAMQKIVGGQWRPGTKFPWDIVVVDNSTFPVGASRRRSKATNA